MGAGILPFCFRNNKLYFLFGKERDIDENPGWSDFGGGSDKDESYIKTATRECSEEISGFLGSEQDLLKHLKTHGYLNIYLENPKNKNKGYMVFLTPIEYDPELIKYFNRYQNFIQNKLDKATLKKSKLFEKTEIKWFSFDDISKNKSKFRKFYQNIINVLLKNKLIITKDCQKLISK